MLTFQKENQRFSNKTCKEERKWGFEKVNCDDAILRKQALIFSHADANDKKFKLIPLDGF